MSDALIKRMAELTDLGWELKSHTDSTAAFETRSPFNWWAFLLWMLLLFGFGAMLYLMYYLLKPKSQLFLVEEKGFLKVMWPSIIVMLFIIAMWFFWIWLFSSYVYY
jgi:hypothetical protein